MKLKKLLAFGLALVMCLAMAACGTNPDEKAEPASITVTENWDFSVGFYPVITPMVSSTYGAGFWSRNFYNTLVSYDDNGKIQGELAETWEISDDGKTYTFHLRDGVKFSDGTPLTSEAVKMTLEAVVTHLGPQNGAFGKLTTLFDKLETPDEKTFVMTLKTPYYAALDNLTMALPLGIVNPAAFEGGVEKAYENCVSATMGTGPYMFDRVEGDTYTFIRNPYYWGEAPEVDEFKVKVIPDNAAKILALRNGEIDAILGSSRLSAEGYTEISQDAAFGHAMDDSTNQTRYLGMNLNKAPFNDPLVREAVSYAVNQQELETSVFDGLETAAETLFPNEKPNCGVEVKTYPTDMEKAKQLMKEAGYEDTNDDGILEKDGTSLAIHFNYSQSLASVDNVADRIIYLEDGHIAGDWTPEQFRLLFAEKRQSMGLRALDLHDEKPICAATPKQPPVLELQNVSLAYKKQPVLRNLSLQAAPGDVIAVVGHNGAGKTTFSRALCGLHKETSGSYLWNGDPQKPKERMKRSYMVMQDVNYQLFAESVEAECTFGIKHPDTELAKKTLEELGLISLRERHPNTLSGGQKQRLAAATSMVCGKELLVFDEPTSGLDYDSMVRLSTLIRRLSDMGKVIFVVTHDYEFVCRTCTRVLHLEGGGIRDDFSVTEALLPTMKKIFDVRREM